ncbi:hypothetical protein LMG19083_03012 [Ralstonia psammae]|uniref:Uncharacterized protein n=1 Tax=Ralstonia psammae TaxID=3058598 RepID=A0ABN9IZK7_9RALS|nr:hypothetical protein [Ralstonia sp. LMG 19083]CAJ0797446.1 hypothetical protein LMG19083_03012 [Ralstonia sp. LMG 19083]
MSRKIHEGDYRRLTLNQKIDGIRVDAAGIWPDDSAYKEVLDSLTGEEAAALLERPDGWTPGEPYIRFPCTLAELYKALGVYSDAIDEDIASEYKDVVLESGASAEGAPVEDWLPPKNASQASEALADTGITRHSAITKRANILAPEIDDAVKKLGMDVNRIYPYLRERALSEEGPFTGVASDGALKYTDANNKEKVLTRDALVKRLKYRQRTLTAASGH